MIRVALATSAALAALAAAAVAAARALATSEQRAADDEADQLVALGAPCPNRRN